MEVSHEEALNVYVDSLEDHIRYMLKTSSRLEGILESEMTKEVFVPKECTGVWSFDAKFGSNIND